MKLSFNLSFGTTPVELKTGVGTAENFLLKEMTAAARDQYLDGLSARMTTDASGKATGIRKFDGIQAELLACCLYREGGDLVSKTEVQAWPASVVSGLFEEAQRLNRLDKADNVLAEAKKE